MQPRPIVVFLKAAITGGAAADLFSAPVRVQGHVNASGTFVAPHASHRMKRRPQAPKPQRQAAPDLFDTPPPAHAAPSLDAPGDPDDAFDYEADARDPRNDPFALPALDPAALARGKQRILPARAPAPAAGAEPRQRKGRAHGPDGDPADTNSVAYRKRLDRHARWHDIGNAAISLGARIHEKAGNGPEAKDPALRELGHKVQALASQITPHDRDPAEDDWSRLDRAADRAGLPRPQRPSDRLDYDPFDLSLRRRRADADAADAEPPAAEPAAPDHLRTVEPHRPDPWGFPRGVKQAERVRANKAAEAILAAKADDALTDDDRAALTRYTGWGGCGTSPNEFFTPPDVARAMWTVLRTLGFRGGEVLEPSAGIGVFQQTAPAGTVMTAVELSATSARINRAIHGARDEVQQGTLEAFAGWDQRKFDAVIGNPPFGDRTFSRYDDLADGKTALGRAEHYFLDTALDKAKDGGLVALIVPRGVMDNPSARDFRARMLAKGQFLTAFRLPNTAFADSHTEVTTDIVVLRKRPQAIASALAALTPAQQAALPHWREDVVAGRYMLEGPGTANVMGLVEAGWRAKLGVEGDITVRGSMLDVPETIAAWQPDPATLADDSPPLALILDTAGDRRDAVERASATEPYPRLAEGETKVENGILYVLRDSRWHRAEEPEPEAVADARRVAALLEPVIEGRAPDMALARAKLTEALDAFMAKHGHPARLRELLDWTSSPQLPTGGADAAGHGTMVAREARRVSLLLGAVRADGTYSDAVTGREAGGPAGSLETIATALAAHEGQFTAAGLAAAAKADPAEVEDFLHAHAGFARMPNGTSWTTMDAYLSGDLWPKHDAATAAARDPELPAAERARMQRQADALLTAIGPMDLGDVTNIQLDSPFIPHECIAAWKKAGDQYGRTWSVRDDRGVITVSAQGKWSGTEVDDLLAKVLMRRGVRKDDANVVEQMHAGFREWLLADPEWRAKVEDRYNRTFRGYAPRTYSTDPIEVPGLSPDFGVHAFQWAGVRWAMERGKGIIAADVGVGKTPRALILNQLLRATGRAKKPIIVMPKSLLSNWHSMVDTMFPGAKVLTIGETITQDADGTRRSRDDDEPTRRKKLATLAQDDHDFVLMTLPAWNMLNLDEERRAKWESEEFFTQRREALEDAARAKKTKGQMKRAAAEKERFEAKQDRARFVNKGEQNITLEQTGVDCVIMDEAHSMKNLATPEAGAFQDLRFLGAPNEPSKQAANSYYKFRWIREKNAGKNVFLLTATPTKNSPLEIYSMMQHVSPEVWTDIGVRNADDFISRFVESSREVILDVELKAEEANVVTGFRNLDEVRQIARRYIDRTTAADVGLKLPTPEVIQHPVEASETQRAEYDRLLPLLEEALKNRDAEGADHPFSIITQMQKVAMDMRLADPTGDHPPSPKLRRIAENAAKLSKEGAQLVFCDYIGGHKMLKDLMVAQGIDPKRIGIINAEATPSSGARQRMTDRLNAGELDVLIGNTATMGEGLNAQKRTTDIHHADIPWEPASMIQRNGRGLRQGNKNAGIRLHSYLTGGSFDGYRWQSMMAKGDWQTAFWGSGSSAENMQRGSLGRLDMLIFSAADPATAREKFAAQLAAAQENRAAAEQADAARLWGRYREAQRQFQAMQAKRRALGRDAPTEPEVKLADRVSGMKARLAAHPAFPWKDQIDQRDVLIDHKTGRVWRPGDEVEIAPGARFRTHSTEPEAFHVSGVDELNGKVTLVPAGYVKTMDSAPAGFRIADIADLRDGVSPTRIDREAAAARQAKRDAERKVAERAAAEAKQKAEADARARAKVAKVERMMAGDGYVHPGELAPMGEAWINEHRDAVRAKLREAADQHAIPGYHSHHVVEGPDGTLRTVAAHGLAKLGPEDHLALPTQATREKLIAAEVAHALDAKIENKHAPVGGRRSFGRQGEYQGAQRVSQDAPHGTETPTMRALQELFPADEGEKVSPIKAEVARRADAAAADRVRAAGDWWQALDAARGGLHNTAKHAYGGMGLAHLQPETAAALLDAATRHGAAEETWNSLSYNRHMQPKGTPSARAVARAFSGEFGYSKVRHTLESAVKPAADRSAA